MEEEPAYDPDALGDAPSIMIPPSSLNNEEQLQQPAVGRDPAANEHTRWDEQKRAWIYTNPKDGSQYRWDPIQQFYVPDVRQIDTFFLSKCACALQLTGLRLLLHLV